MEAHANARWSIIFVYDQFGCGRRLRLLNVVDNVTRECLAPLSDTSTSGLQVRVLPKSAKLVRDWPHQLR